MSTTNLRPGSDKFRGSLPPVAPDAKPRNVSPKPLPSAHTSPAKRNRSRKRLWLGAGLAAVLAVLILIPLKGTGLKTIILCKLVPGYLNNLAAPEVVGFNIKDGASGIKTDTACVITLKIPTGHIDETSLSAGIFLIRVGDQQPMPIDIFVEEAGSRLVVKPKSPLAEKTQFALLLTDTVKDRFNKTLRPAEFSFTTAGKSDPELRFTRIPMVSAKGTGFTAVVMSPFKDRTLWAASDDGRIFQFPIMPDGTLGPRKSFTTLNQHEKGARILTGFCFDPASTPENPILWCSHNYGSFENVPDFSGKISRISGHDLENVEDVVIDLPRSVKDHMNNQPVFGPDGALYWCQPSNSAYGEPDEIWGMRPEHLLNATILRLDTKRWTPGHPIDAKTTDAGGTYDPFAKDAPLTIHAFGVRLGYDLLWHSNGQLYVPVNGSAAGGNSPASAAAPALSQIPLDEDDWLFRIVPGKYYGHPNPTQKHLVLNGGNPTSGFDFAEMPLYPVGTKPDPDWQRADWVLGRHVSANGVIEYKDVAFSGKLDKTIMICRYNFGGDILVLHLDKDGHVISDDCTIPGLGKLASPLDLAEDLTTGNLYVSEYGGQCITLLRAERIQ